MRHQVQLHAILCLAAWLIFAGSSWAQNAPIPVTVEDGQSGFNNGPVMPVGLSVPARMMNGPRVASVEDQIRLNVRYVMLDPETRTRIYQRLGSDRLKTVGSQVPNLRPDFDAAEAADTRGTEFIAKSSRVTTCVLNSEELDEFLQDVESSVDSQVTRAPSIVLVDGQDTAMTDLIQRPFVVNLQRRATKDQPAVNSEIQVLNEGISMHLNASFTPSERIHVVSKLVLEKILDVESEEVFGVSEKATTVQVPVHQRKTIHATENLDVGQTLLIDPYVKHELNKALTTGVPILSSIPYISDSFINTETVSVKQQMVVLIQPMIEKEPVSSLPRG